MNYSLRLWLEPDADGTGELFAKVSLDQFSGAGSAWFSIEKVSEFAEKLGGVYPYPRGARYVLQGGHWSDANPGELETVLVRLSFYPLGPLGAVGCMVELATPKAGEKRLESISSVCVEIVTDYAAVAEFSKSLVAVAAGEADEALLQDDG